MAVPGRLTRGSGPATHDFLAADSNVVGGRPWSAIHKAALVGQTFRDLVSAGRSGRGMGGSSAKLFLQRTPLAAHQLVERERAVGGPRERGSGVMLEGFELLQRVGIQ